MKQINLRELYPDIYKTDVYLDVSDEVQAVFLADRRAEAARERQMYRYKAYFSLDRGDGIEHDATMQSATPETILENEQERELLYSALSQLPDKQAKRIYAHYILGVSKAELARKEGVCESAIRESINRALKHLFETMKNLF